MIYCLTGVEDEYRARLSMILIVIRSVQVQSELDPVQVCVTVKRGCNYGKTPSGMGMEV